MVDSPVLYQRANSALDDLNAIWKHMIAMLETISVVSSKTLTEEPNLMQLQDMRKQYVEQLTNLKSTLTWLDANRVLPEAGVSTADSAPPNLLKTHSDLTQESSKVTNKLKKLIGQSYALQFQIDLLLSSSLDSSSSTDKA